MRRGAPGTGVVFRRDLVLEAWGAWSFIVADPDGNLLQFYGEK